MKIHYCLIFILLIFTISCKNRSERINSSETTDKSENETTKAVIIKPKQADRKIGKAVFYLENSGSMFGYVNGFTEYVDVVSELAEKPRFAEEKTRREFYFVNGKNPNLKVNNLGNNPKVLKENLTRKAYEKYGDKDNSDLNSIFQIALSKAKNDTISILISDAIYDIGKPDAPMNVLSTEGRETRSRFIERLNDGDLQTIIIKLNSHFDGNYFPVTGGSVRLSQDRPFYVWIFGETELLNEYFPEDYIKSLKGYSDVARFLKLSELEIPYQVIAHNKIGDFKFAKNNKNKLENVKTNRNGQGFQFTIATDFSTLPFSDSHLNAISNYSCNNTNYSINNASRIGDLKIYGLNFTPTHLITAYTNKSPLCQLDISLLNTVPNWIENTNSDDEKNIVGDTSHTFGFKFLTNAISEAYQYKNKEANIVTFKFELIK
jgi:hypothetical protein